MKESLVAGRRFFTFPNLEIVDVDLEVLSMAQKITEGYNVKPRDAIHAACALKYCSGQIITNDSDFDVIGEIRRKF